MTWGFVAHRGTANDKTASTSIGVNPNAAVPIGAVLVVRVASDNLSTVAGETNNHTSVSDSKGQSYQKIREHTQTAGAAADGVTASVWIRQLNWQLETTDLVTVYFSGSITAKVIALEEYSVSSGKTFTVAGKNGAHFAASTTPTVTLSGLSSKEYLWIGNIGLEGPNGDTFTQDTDYVPNHNTSVGTTGGTEASNASSRNGDRIYTGTGDTYNPTLGSARDCVAIIAALEEISILTGGLYFFTDAPANIAPTIKNSWQDVEVPYVPLGSTGIILEVIGEGFQYARLRKKGSTFVKEQKMPESGRGVNVGWAFVGIDANRIFQAYVGTGVELWLIGYTGSDVVYFDNPTDENPASVGSWLDVDKGALIPSGATGVVACGINPTGNEYIAFGVRCNGSTDEFPYGYFGSDSSHLYQYCGLDTNRIYEVKVSDLLVEVYTIAFFKGEVHFNVNGVLYDPTTANAWADLDVTSGTSATANGALPMLKSYTNWVIDTMTVRANGSIDNRTALRGLLNGTTGQCVGAAIKLDSDQVLEYYVSTVNVDIYVIGYNQPAGITEVSITDSLGLSDVVKVDKTLYISDSLALADIIMALIPTRVTEWGDIMAAYQINEIGLRRINGVLEDGTLVFIPIGAQLIEILDSLGLSDSVLTHKTLIIPDALNLSDVVLRDKSITILDSIGLADSITISKLIEILDGLGLSDAVSTNKQIIIADNLGLLDQILTNKTLIVVDALNLSDIISLVEEIEKKLFAADVLIPERIFEGKSLLFGFPYRVVSDEVGLRGFPVFSSIRKSSSLGKPIFSRVVEVKASGLPFISKSGEIKVLGWRDLTKLLVLLFGDKEE